MPGRQLHVYLTAAAYWPQPGMAAAAAAPRLTLDLDNVELKPSAGARSNDYAPHAFSHQRGVTL